MKSNILILIIIFTLSNFLSFSQIKVLSTGKVAVGGGTTYNAARLNISDTDNSTIYSKINHSFPWGDAIKSEVNRADAIAYSVYFNNTRSFMVFGNGDIWSATKITFSDSILKYDIKNVEGATDLLNKLQGVTYIKKNESKDHPVKHIGLIAQEVEKILPDLVYTDQHGVKGVAYEEIIPLLIEAVKNQQAQIEILKSTIASIEANCCTGNLKSASIANEAALTEKVAQLNQNIPNPFNKETRIDCFIPATSGNSILYIYNMNGMQLQQFRINGKGEQSITINGNSLEPGMYLYALVIDGREVDTKRMILTK